MAEVCFRNERGGTSGIAKEVERVKRRGAGEKSRFSGLR